MERCCSVWVVAERGTNWMRRAVQNTNLRTQYGILRTLMNISQRSFVFTKLRWRISWGTAVFVINVHFCFICLLLKVCFVFPTLQRGNKIGLLTVTSSNHMSTPSLQLLVFFYSSPPFCLFCVSASLVSNMSAVMRSEDSGEQRIVPTETLGENRQAMISAVHTHTQTAVFNENFSATDV